ncbi:MAG: trypsin-like peptidase domain-containing protein [Oscillospiraceae bacterium]|jgi:serine protease Do|nr:trypsin-like peptidase domain-containing protein [Oscillospiraceae bacterium]
MKRVRISGKSLWPSVIALCAVMAILVTGYALGMRQSAAVAEAAAPLETLPGVESPFQTVYKQVSPSVVSVNVVQRASFQYGRVYQSAQSQLAGSGVVVRVEGSTRYIVTNNHVVEGATSYSITVGGEEYPAELVASDSTTDLAVLKVTDAALTLPAVPLGDSDAVEVGEWVMVIGTPLDASLTNTLTVGVVSGLNREVPVSSSSNRQRTTTISTDMIQTDAAINSGNSGGAMFNTKGELIGIPSIKMSSSGMFGIASIEGVGYAIPVNTVKTVVPDLIQYQQVMRPRIGVSISDTGSDTDEPTESSLPKGIVIQIVESGSPAEQAGLKPYDIIMKADGERVRTTSELTAKVQSHKVGETVTLEVYRIPNLSGLKMGDPIPEGETLNFDVEVKILDDVQTKQ